MSRNRFAALFSRSNDRSRRQPTGNCLTLESLETRDLMATLAVDIGDASCGDDGDNLYCEIQEAVVEAKEGDKILVREGTYDPFSIDKNDLRIQAVGSGEVIIDVNAVIDDELEPEVGIELNADGVSIKGLTVKNARGIGILVTGDHNRLQKNVVENTSEAIGRVGHGIGLRSADHNTLTGNTSRDNSRMGFQLFDSNSNRLLNNLGSGNVNGIDLFASEFNTINGNTTTQNNNGIVLSGGIGVPAGHNLVRGNLTEDNNFRGVFLIGRANENVLEGNTSRNNGLQGYLLVFGPSFNTLRGNIAEGNGTTGDPDNDDGFTLAFGANNNTLQGNLARDNVGTGFVTALSSNFNTLQGNMALRNGGDGFLLASNSGDNTLKSNTAIGNVGDGFRVESGLNTLRNNTAVRNNGYGFYVDEMFADDNEFAKNHCVLNGRRDSNIDEIC